MWRMTGVGILIALAVVMVFGLATGAFAQDATPIASEGLPGGIVLRVVERAEADTVIDLGEKGDSIGDLLAFGNPIYDPANQTKLADDQGSCVRTVVGKSWECVWTLILPEGQITVEGPFYDAADSVLAITGGTGAYRDARGQMTLHARNAEGTEYDFTYEIE
ncbi:MAG TPA: allene oxide cyclase family protein [Thermomicrobiales bacterium]|nr:allene oxide cyclase family protein [Thermomicrobiales bacterium]